jgi:tetratricopeptide (TPR) repeat protein
MHRRELFERAGGMDESLSVLIDWDLWRRFAALTMPYHVSKATAEYFIRGGRATRGQGHLTNMHDADRPRYFAHRARIINKRLGDGSDERLEKGQAFYRKRSRAEFLAVRGDWHAAGGRFARAERAYRLAAKIAPGELSVLRRLGHFLMRRGRSAEAAGPFAQAVDLQYAAQEDFFNLAVALAHSGRFEEGQRVIDAITRRFHSSPETEQAIRRFWSQILAKLEHDSGGEGMPATQRAAG